MEHCLRTQLKASVNNNNVPYLGGIRVFVTEDTGTPNYNARNITPVMSDYGEYKAKVVSGNIYFTDSTGSANYGTTVNLSDRHDLYISNGDGVVLIEGKYNLTSFSCPPTSFIKIPISDFSGIQPPAGFALDLRGAAIGTLPSNSLFMSIRLLDAYDVDGDVSGIDTSLLSLIDVTNSNIGGNLIIPSALTTLIANRTPLKINTSDIRTSNLTKINLLSCPNVIGNFSGCANGKLTELEIRGSGINGSVESYVEEEWANSRRSGNVSIVIGGNLQTFHGEYYESNSLYIVFGASSVTIRQSNSSGEVLATYDGSSWTYA